MSFQEPRDAITICNRALAQVYQQPMAGTLDAPANISARECARWYKTVVRALLEKHHFGLATKRTPLVSYPTSDRAEWPYAYLAPSDMAFPVSLDIYGDGASQISYYRGIGYLIGQFYGRPVFLHQGNRIYSHLSSPSLDYVSYDITEADFSQQFENLVVMFLAAALAGGPLVKDRAMAEDLNRTGNNELNQVIAQSLNATNPRYDTGPSEAELARAGGDPRLVTGLWDMR